MKLDLYRRTFTDNSTIGDLYINGTFFCYTLEDTCREIDGAPVNQWKVQNKTAIPSGTYKLLLDMSQRFKKVMPRLLNVDGFTGVRIHSGNTSHDTEGCVLVGATKAKDLVGNSRATFDKLMDRLEAAAERSEKMSITIHGTRQYPAILPTEAV